MIGTDSSWVVPTACAGPRLFVSYRAEDSLPVATTLARELELT